MMRSSLLLLLLILGVSCHARQPRYSSYYANKLSPPLHDFTQPRDYLAQRFEKRRQQEQSLSSMRGGVADWMMLQTPQNQQTQPPLLAMAAEAVLWIGSHLEPASRRTALGVAHWWSNRHDCRLLQALSAVARHRVTAFLLLGWFVVVR